MEKQDNEITAFIDELRDNPAKSGKLIGDFIKKKNRIFLNFPLIGPARRISSELSKGPFSYFYVFERTLSHKLHPLLYRYGFNFLSNSIVDSLYERKLEFYKPLIPLRAGKIPGDTAGLRMKNLVMMKELITRMVFKDGHFMVIKYYDNNFRKLSSGLSGILRSIELSMHLMKKNLTEEKNTNSEMIRKRFELFRQNQGKENGTLFIERMEWDEDLKEYAEMLKGNEDESYTSLDSSDPGLRVIDLENVPDDGEKTGEEQPPPEKESQPGEEKDEKRVISGYAESIREKYLDAISDEDADAVKKILDTIYTTNGKKSGKARAEEIVSDIINIWLNDELISSAKKDFLRSLHADMFGGKKEKQTPEDQLDAITDFVNNLEEDEKGGVPEEVSGVSGNEPAESGISGSDEMDDLAGFFDIDEPSSEEDLPFVIREDESGEPGGFAISAAEGTGESGEFPVHGSDETAEPGVFPVSEAEEPAEPGDFHRDEKQDAEEVNAPSAGEETGGEEGGIPEWGEKRLQEIDERLRKRTREQEEEARDIVSGGDSDRVTACALKMLGRETGSRSLFKILPDADGSGGGENIFIRIIRRLEEGPFRYMTPGEKAAFIDRLIDIFSKEKKLVSQLENYRKLIEKPSELLMSVTNNLERIEKENPDLREMIEAQLKYLEKVLENEDYEAVWLTVKSLYRNIIRQKSDNVIETVLGEMTGQPRWKQAVVLKYLERFYRGDRIKQDELGRRTAFPDIKSLSGRLENERKGITADINEVFKEVTGESAGISEWAGRIIGEKGEPVPETGAVYESLKGFLQSGDFSDETDAVRLTGELEEMIRLNAEKTLIFLDTVLSSADVSDDAKRIILRMMNDSDRPEYLEIHDLHRTVESVDSPDEKKAVLNRFKGILGNNFTPEEVTKILHRKLAYIKQESGKMRAERRVHDILAGGDSENMRSLMDSVASGTGVSGKISITVKKIGEAFDADKLDEAFSAITCSTNSPEMKIRLLETLREMVKGKLSSVEESEKGALVRGIKKIENKIGFYGNILEERKGERKRSRKRIEMVLKEGPVKGGKKAAGDDQQDEKEMTPEEQVYSKTLSLVKSFADNIDALGPVMEILAGFNRGDFQFRLMNEYTAALKRKEMLVRRTVNVIKTGKIDSDLVKILHRSPPRFQYNWSEGVKKKLGAGSLEEAVKPVEKNREVYGELIRIAKIIRSNNKNDFLKKSIEKEKKLVSDIAANFSIEGIGKLKSGIMSSKDKDKINLFRDLVKLTGVTADSARNGYLASVATHAALKQKSGLQEREGAVEKSPVKREEGKKSEVPDEERGPAVKDIVNEINNFINLCKSERTGSMAVKSSRRLITINSFFKHLASGENAYVELAKKNTDELKEVFRGIIKHRFKQDFPAAGPALKYCIDNGLIKKSDLL